MLLYAVLFLSGTILIQCNKNKRFDDHFEKNPLDILKMPNVSKLMENLDNKCLKKI